MNQSEIVKFLFGRKGLRNIIIIIITFRKYISNIPGNREVKELQKTATLGTAHILRKVLT